MHLLFTLLVPLIAGGAMFLSGGGVISMIDDSEDLIVDPIAGLVLGIPTAILVATQI